MAQRLQLVDDIDGTDAVETVNFAIDGISYEIDLNDDHASELRAAFANWVEKARRVRGRRTTGRSSSRGGSYTNEIREWAQAQGLDVNSRGRVSAEIRKAYEKAHS